MRDIGRRLKNIEKRLNLGEKLVTITIVQFGGQLPPGRTEGNITYRYIMYDEKVKQWEVFTDELKESNKS